MCPSLRLSRRESKSEKYQRENLVAPTFSEISGRKFLEVFIDKKFHLKLFANAANLAANGLNLNSWLSAFYPVPNLRL